MACDLHDGATGAIVADSEPRTGSVNDPAASAPVGAPPRLSFLDRTFRVSERASSVAQELVAGQMAAERVWTLHAQRPPEGGSEGLRRLLLAIIRDLRVVFILLARQLARMRAAGILPDGTPFNIPGDADHPSPLDLPDSARRSTIYLMLPTRQPGAIEASPADRLETAARFSVGEH